jgi:hypothetical protein
MKHLAQFAAQVAAMSDDQRAAIAARMPITTIEGRALSMRKKRLGRGGRGRVFPRSPNI